jgi:hypothetical protein
VKRYRDYSPALSAGLPVLVPGHEDTGTTGGLGAFSTETLDTALRVDLVVLEDGHLDLLPLVLDLLGGGLQERVCENGVG